MCPVHNKTISGLWALIELGDGRGLEVELATERLTTDVNAGRNTYIVLVVIVIWVSAMFVYNNKINMFVLSHLLSKDSPVLNSFLQYGEDHTSLNRECVFPSTDPFDPALKKFVKTYPPFNCSKNTPHIVYVEKFVIKVNRTKLKRVLQPGAKFKHCRYKEILRLKGSDKRIYYGEPSTVFTQKMVIKPRHENIVVECYISDDTVFSRSYFALIRVNPEKERALKKQYKKHLLKNSPLETLSIFMIGMDGMSKQNFERTMPKTRNFLLDELGAIELHKYNKLGYSTLPNVVALLTGNSMGELNSNLKFKKGFFDPVNRMFLWSEAKKLGYRTGMILDNKEITSFHYLRKGFNQTPVDYYLRPTLLAWRSDTLMRGKYSNCFGDSPVVTLLYDYWIQMASTFKNENTPFFGYSFAAHLTHDNCHEASKGDDAYHKFLQDLVATGGLNNTVIVWFSDHGQRFGRIRSTYQGRIETNTPYLLLIFPQWFKQKYPEVMQVLKINQERLTTHFDVYETVKDLLYFKAKTGKGTVHERGISLFKEIPRERTCAQAGVPDEFCACAQFSQPQINDTVRNLITSAFLERVNSFTQDITDKCARLSIASVESVLQVTSNSLRTMKARNFRVVITVTPGSGRFEGLVQLSNKTEQATVVGEVVRSNLYRGQADCVSDPFLRQFCYCTV
ncbi:hypothetical protein PoB_000155300 [Plakobranchus ocellatus]|uniref:Sulfatase N-terminal domain-containing protein n=1 Tax=Plakobranchus ocellatus TaxID=259542 RepID=A0AAV3XXF4_9GAST|nr:hypothetical protein PoB_000155300 [Plakobranchus ocellatus]